MAIEKSTAAESKPAKAKSATEANQSDRLAKVAEGSPLAGDAGQRKAGEAFTPEQADEIEAGTYPTPRQLTPEEKEAAALPKPELQEEQEERIEKGTQSE